MGDGAQLEARRRDGSEFPAEISLSAVSTDGGMMVLAAVRDVTERVRADLERAQLEAQLFQSRRLESLGQLAGGVAHDFNNLLGAVLGYAEILRDEISHLPIEGHRQNLLLHDVEQISRAVGRGAALTRQLLAFGRRELIRPEVLELNTVVSGIEELLRRTLGEDIELEITLTDARSNVVADRGQLEQVLVNLAVNARDAMIGGGTLLIDSAVVDVDGQMEEDLAKIPPGRYVRLRVSDTGTGMQPEVLEHAFEPFFTTKPPGQGTGLGLATVYGIVTQAGGFARIYSEVGLGTSFLALFPSSDVETVDPVIAAAAVVDQGTETLLLVEDDPAVRETTSRMLQRNGYEVLVAMNGAQALEVARTHTGRIDLLVTDVVMPTMLGIEVAERVRALRRGIPVLFMSAYAEPVLSNKGTLDPGIVLIEKPFSEVALLAVVRGLLDDQPG
jgi:hypothetical protein